MSRRAAKVDRNHAEIVEAFRRLGFAVQSLARLGNGVPDLLVYRQPDALFLVEVKAQKGQLRQQQVQFMARWPVQIVRSVEDVMQIARAGQIVRSR